MIRPFSNRRAGVALVALALFLGGCGKGANRGGPADDMQNFELHEIWALFDLHAMEKGRPPSKLADLQTYEVGYSEGFRALQKGDCIAVWGVDPRKKDANAVLAYQKATPTQGGLVVMADKKIKSMTADEFKAANVK